MMEPQILSQPALPTSPKTQQCKSPELNDFRIKDDELLDSDKSLPGVRTRLAGGEDSCGTPGGMEVDEEEEDYEDGDIESNSSSGFRYYKSELHDTEAPTAKMNGESKKADGVKEKISPSVPESVNFDCFPGQSAFTMTKLNAKTVHRPMSGTRTEQSPKTGKSTTTLGASSKTCAKKSFVWKYFQHPEMASGGPDRSRTQCVLCDSQLAFNASGTTTTMLNHLKSRHGDIAEQEELQRRHTRPKGGATNHGPISVNGMLDTGDSESIDVQRGTMPSNTRISRSPIGQRGRPPGSGRRPKHPKVGESGDYLAQNSSMSTCPLKPETNPLFPWVCYPGLIETRTLINQMLLSTEALTGVKDIAFLPSNDSRLEDGVPPNCANVIRTSGANRTDQPVDGSLSAVASKMFASSAFGGRSLPNHFPPAVTGPMPHELSPSSSSGLGVSVSSPLETPTTTVSPTNSTDNRSVTSPTNQSHWSGGQLLGSQNTKMQISRTRECGQSLNLSLSNGHAVTSGDAVVSPLNASPLTTNGHGLVSSPVPSVNSGVMMAQNGELESKWNPLNILGRDGTVNLVPGLPSSLQVTMANNSSHPNDLCSTFGNLINIFPSLATGMNGAHYPAVDPFPLVQPTPSPGVTQQAPPPQQQWLTANAWQLLNNPASLADPTTVLNFLTNSMAHLPPTSNKTTYNTLTTNGIETTQGRPNLSFPVGSLLDPSHTGSLIKSNSDELIPWPPQSAHVRPTNEIATISSVPSVLTYTDPLSSSVAIRATVQPQSHQPPAHHRCSQELEKRILHSAAHSNDTLMRARSSQSSTRTGSPMSMPSPEQAHHMNSLDLSKTRANDLTHSSSSSYALSVSDKVGTVPVNDRLSHHPDENNQVTASTKRKRARPVYISPECDSLAYFVVKDLQPPEVVEGEGFRSLMASLTEQETPTTEQLRETLSTKIVKEVRTKLNSKLDSIFEAQSTSNGESTADPTGSASLTFSLEIWPVRKVIQTSDIGIPASLPDGPHTFLANFAIHCSSIRTPQLQSYLYDCIELTTMDCLKQTLQRCRSRFTRLPSSVISSTPSTNELESELGSSSWPCPVVTNEVQTVCRMLMNQNEGREDTTIEYLVIPCLVSALTRAVITINQTVELIHRNDLILTASMIEPILQNLSQTHLAPLTNAMDTTVESDTQVESNVIRETPEQADAVEEFKAIVLKHLTICYPESGAMRDTLQLASLLDPRFKKHVQEHKPATVKLLKSKVETLRLPSDGASRGSSFNFTTSCSSSSFSESSASLLNKSKSSADTVGLQNVFGLQCFPRTSLSEVDRYLREEPIGLEEDPLIWWAEKSSSYPRVALLATHYLAIPLTCFVTGRLQSTTVSETYDEHPVYNSITVHDGLGLPNIVDPLGRDRGRLREADQAMFTISTLGADKRKAGLLVAVEPVTPSTNELESELGSSSWPCPVVTNEVQTVCRMLMNQNEGREDTTIEYLVIPCLVSALTRAVIAGLQLPCVQTFLDRGHQAIKSVERVTDSTTKVKNLLLKQNSLQEARLASPKCVAHIENRNYETAIATPPCESWSEAFNLLKITSVRTPDSSLSEKDIQLFKNLQTVLETINQTVELIHRNDLILTASMIEPILQNLSQTHLAPLTNAMDTTVESDTQVESNVIRETPEQADAVEEFKAIVLKHLTICYPESGAMRDTLQLASLLDPRFKKHVQEHKPATVKLLKSKVETLRLPSDGASRGSSFNFTTSCSSSSFSESSASLLNKSKSSADTVGLQNVFGLQCFPRTSLSEVDRYLREEPIGLEEDPLIWWAEKSSSYPRVALLATHYLAIPLTCFVTGRLQSTTVSETYDEHPVYNSITVHDGLGLPNIVDPLGRDRGRLREADQAMYNFLWHNWKMESNFE
ncbi:hypothetical protein AHF37_04710 [Paragonimus kellicotti]|nr:hypothetical protein AHF37_04710 [Paragonimus kellicotti]